MLPPGSRYKGSVQQTKFADSQILDIELSQVLYFVFHVHRQRKKSCYQFYSVLGLLVVFRRLKHFWRSKPMKQYYLPAGLKQNRTRLTVQYSLAYTNSNILYSPDTSVNIVALTSTWKVRPSLRKSAMFNSVIDEQWMWHSKDRNTIWLTAVVHVCEQLLCRILTIN